MLLLLISFLLYSSLGEAENKTTVQNSSIKSNEPQRANWFEDIFQTQFPSLGSFSNSASAESFTVANDKITALVSISRANKKTVAKIVVLDKNGRHIRTITGEEAKKLVADRPHLLENILKDHMKSYFEDEDLKKTIQEVEIPHSTLKNVSESNSSTNLETEGELNTTNTPVNDLLPSSDIQEEVTFNSSLLSHKDSETKEKTIILNPSISSWIINSLIEKEFFPKHVYSNSKLIFSNGKTTEETPLDLYPSNKEVTPLWFTNFFPLIRWKTFNGFIQINLEKSKIATTIKVFKDQFQYGIELEKMKFFSEEEEMLKSTINTTLTLYNDAISTILPVSLFQNGSDILIKSLNSTETIQKKLNRCRYQNRLLELLIANLRGELNIYKRQFANNNNDNIFKTSWFNKNQFFQQFSLNIPNVFV